VWYQKKPSVFSGGLDVFISVILAVSSRPRPPFQVGVCSSRYVSGCSSFDNIKMPKGQKRIAKLLHLKGISIRNPATGRIFIFPPAAAVSIADPAGRVVLHQQQADIVDISSLPNGIYLIRIADPSGMVLQVEKFVKGD